MPPQRRAFALAQQNTEPAAPARRLRAQPRREKPCVPMAPGIVNWLEARVCHTPRDLRLLARAREAAPDRAGPYGAFAPAGVPGSPAATACPREVRSINNKERHSVTCAAFTPGTQRLLTGSASGEVTLWDGHAFTFETLFQAHDASLRCLEWRHGGDFMASADDTGAVKFWSPQMGLLTEFVAHASTKVQALSFSPGDAKMASAGDDGRVHIYHCGRPQQPERVIVAHGSDVRAAAWHPRMGLVASASSRDTPVKLWDPRQHGDAAALRTAHPHNVGVARLAWDAPGGLLATAGRDGAAAILDVRRFERPLLLLGGHTDGVTSLAFHADCAPLLATGSGRGELAFWSTRDGGAKPEPVAPRVQAHAAAIWALRWRRDGAALVSGSADTNVKIWARDAPSDAQPREHTVA